jgi:hypothetical protein
MYTVYSSSWKTFLSPPTGRFDRTPGTPLGVRTTPMIIHAYVQNSFMCSRRRRRKSGGTRSILRLGPRRYARPVMLRWDWTPRSRASRGKVQDTPTPLTVHEAMNFWFARTENKLGKDASTIGSIDTWRSWFQSGRERTTSSMRKTLPAISWKSGTRRRDGPDSLLRPGSSGGRSCE